MLKGECATKHSIELTHDRPIFQRPYKMCPIRTAQLKSAVADLVKNGILEEGHSAYAMPLFFVKK